MLNGAPTQVSANSPEKLSPDRTHVLVVDDDPSIRQMVVDYLGDNEMQVTALASGREIADVTRETIDLLILDLKLPGEDGMDIARRIRADSNMPIIMLTARKEEADRVMALEAAQARRSARLGSRQVAHAGKRAQQSRHHWPEWDGRVA
jgi:CheY-like chemotaxis protein